MCGRIWVVSKMGEFFLKKKKPRVVVIIVIKGGFFFFPLSTQNWSLTCEDWSVLLLLFSLALPPPEVLGGFSTVRWQNSYVGEQPFSIRVKHTGRGGAGRAPAFDLPDSSHNRTARRTRRGGCIFGPVYTKHRQFRYTPRIWQQGKPT